MNGRRILSVALLVALLIPGVVRAEDDSAKIDQSTPQKAAEGFASSMSKKQYSRGFQYLTPESRDLMVGAFAKILPFVYRFAKTEQQKKDLEAIIKKHKIDWDLTKPAPAPDAFKKIADKGAFFGDILNYFEKQNPNKKKSGSTPFGQMAKTKFTNFKIEGDTATADVTVNGKKTPQPAIFKRIQGKWYVDLAEAQRRARERIRKKAGELKKKIDERKKKPDRQP